MQRGFEYLFDYSADATTPCSLQPCYHRSTSRSTYCSKIVEQCSSAAWMATTTKTVPLRAHHSAAGTPTVRLAHQQQSRARAHAQKYVTREIQIARGSKLRRTEAKLSGEDVTGRFSLS